VADENRRERHKRADVLPKMEDEEEEKPRHEASDDGE
jgi:hypothetical protein